jgi:glycosyltransferase involved in cell wall biosynthesis
MSGPTILIVTYNWPPRNAIGTHRPYSWARYWSERGASVRVLTAEKRDFDHPLDLRLPLIEGVTVKESSYSALPGASRGRALPAALVSLLKWVRRKADHRLGIVLDPRDGWMKSALDDAEALSEGVDVVVSTFGPRATHEIAAHLKKRNPGLFWVADYRDLWSQNFLRKWSGRARRKERQRELGCLASADLVTTVSDELASSLSCLLDCEVHVVTNGFDEAADAGASAKVDAASPGRPLVLAYTGIVHEPWQDPSPLFKAIALLRDEGTIRAGDLYVDFYGGRGNSVAAKALRAGIQEFVRCHGHVTRDEALQRQRSAGALLLLENASPEARGILTGKLFEYLAARVPILSVGGTPSSAADRVLAYCHSGVSLGTESARIAAQLRDLLRGHRPDWFFPDDGRIMEFSRRQQAVGMLDRIRQAMEARDGHR